MLEPTEFWYKRSLHGLGKLLEHDVGVLVLHAVEEGVHLHRHLSAPRCTKRLGFLSGWTLLNKVGTTQVNASLGSQITPSLGYKLFGPTFLIRWKRHLSVSSGSEAVACSCDHLALRNGIAGRCGRASGVQNLNKYSNTKRPSTSFHYSFPIGFFICENVSHGKNALAQPGSPTSSRRRFGRASADAWRPNNLKVGRTRCHFMASMFIDKMKQFVCQSYPIINKYLQGH